MLTSKLLKFKLVELFALIKYSILASLIMTITLGTLLMIFNYLGVEINLPIIAFIILAGASSYLITHYIYDSVEFLHFISEFKYVIKIK